jgi:hypothetical protein
MANSSALAGATINSISVFVLSSNVTVERTTIPVTALGDTWETNVQGVARVSGSIEVAYDKSDHANIIAHMTGATGSVAATFTWNTSETWTGNLIVNSASATAAVDDIVKATINFVGTGTWSC